MTDDEELVDEPPAVELIPDADALAKTYDEISTKFVTDFHLNLYSITGYNAAANSEVLPEEGLEDGADSYTFNTVAGITLFQLVTIKKSTQKKRLTRLRQAKTEQS